MKWKAMSPEAKRRSSNSFFQRNQSDYYNNNNNNNNNYYEEPYNYSNFRNDFNHYNNYPGYRNQFLDDYYLDQTDKIDDFNHKYSNHSWQQDDQDEDELYFHGGSSRKKDIKKDEYNKNNNEDYKTNNEEYDFEEYEEYNPEDFDGENEPSSSWSEDSEFEEVKSKRKKPKNSTGNQKRVEKATVVERADGSIIKPKVYVPKVIDLDAPTVTKLPSNPIPNTWAHLVHNPLRSLARDDSGCIEICTPSICEDLGWLKHDGIDGSIQGILMRPPFSSDFPIKRWAKLMQKTILPQVLQDGGYLFIWVEREELAEVIRAAEKYLSFKYVENLCWIRRDLGNRILHETGPCDGGFGLFYKSKMTLLILRRDPHNRCKLRHQRNPDCVFDFVGPGRMPDGRVYDVIETLLDGTTTAKKPHLMHLWASSSSTDRLVYRNRKNWIRVIEEEEEEEEFVVDDDDKSDVKTEEIFVKTEPDDDKILNPIIDNINTTNDINDNNVNNKLNSSNFDEDFCNFILYDPIL